MSQINELRANRARTWEQAKAFLDTHRNEKGLLSAEDTQTYERMEQEIVDLGHEIERQERMDAMERELNLPVNAPITEKPQAGASTVAKRASDTYRVAFDNYLHARPSNTYGDLQEGTDSEGGYLVPQEFERTLVDGLKKTDPIFGLAHHISMGAHEKVVPIVTAQGAAALVSEEGSYGADGDTFGQKHFKAYKFGRIIKVSDELLADSAFDLERYINGSLADSIGKGEAGYFWTGTGSSQPEGIMSLTESITTATQGTIVADEIIDLYFALPEQYRGRATWAFSNTALKEVRKLKDGEGQYLWQPGFGNQPDTILGRPVVTSEHIAAMGNSAKVCVFGDFDYFWIGDRSGVSIKRLNELYAGNGQVGFRGDARTDSHVMGTEAFAVLKTHA